MLAKLGRFFLASILLSVIITIVLTVTGFHYAYLPTESKAVSRNRAVTPYYDRWGETLSVDDARRQGVSPATGGVLVDSNLLAIGRREFYTETFGNEFFLTDVLGIIDGPLTLPNILKALVALNGRGTTNLRVALSGPVTIGGRAFQDGELVDTGIDVPRESFAPLGMRVVYQGGVLRVGITCAACHSTVDPHTLNVVEGAPNADLNAGLLLALATNSAAYFMHTDVNPAAIGDPKALEDAVDAVLLKWPPGDFDSMADMKADPNQIPSSFSLGNHPYSWSGVFMAGPFHGLSAQTNNVHALNSDSTLLADSAPVLFGLDRDSYLAVLLRNAASSKLRYNAARGESASAFWKRVGRSNRVVIPPTYPHATPLTPDGTYTTSPGLPFWQQVNAMAAWQNTLVPPPGPVAAESERALGRAVFERAGCVSCHSGPFLTNNQVVPAAAIGTDPVRAQAMTKAAATLVPAVIPGFDGSGSLTVPVNYDQGQFQIAWAMGNPGGYKVPSLIGLAWTAPYLHDGGVSVGPNANSQVGVPATLQRFIRADPGNSLRALLDRALRARVVAANGASRGLQSINISGAGHEFWVDAAAGFAPNEINALIAYLLAVPAPAAGNSTSGM